MTDYSKPIGYWCSNCGARWSAHGDTDDICAPEPIPVYAVIPEGEREETTIESLDELEVCTINDDDFAVGGALMSSDVIVDHQHGQPIADRMAWFQNQHPRLPAPADVVLWVAEGKLP